MIHIEPLQPGDWSAALELALGRVPAGDRAAQVAHGRHLLASGTIDPGAVRVARAEGGAIVGVQVCVPLPGSSCLFWLPTAADDIADLLVRACLDECRAHGIKLAQAFVVTAELPFATPLLRQGFLHVTGLQQLQNTLGEMPAPMSSALRLETWQASRPEDFARTLQRTYQGTLDCPELNGQRDIAEIIAGHRAEGNFDPTRWWLAYENEEPIGVLMLMELADRTTWDLSYVGIVPEHRRRGHGRRLVQHALQVARHQLATRLIVAVDARNIPARQIYRSLGFEPLTNYEVLLKFLSRSVVA